MKTKNAPRVIRIGLLAIAIGSASMLSAPGFAEEASPDASVTEKVAPTTDQQVFATVNDAMVSKEDFDIALGLAIRSRFYHGRPPEGELAELQREIGEKLINDLLLVAEAQRRGLVVDENELQARLAEIDARNQANAQWQSNRDSYLPKVTTRLQNEDLLKQLEVLVKDVPTPNYRQVLAYYEKHPEKFTEPEQLRVSVILLAVDPSSPSAKWKEAYDEGKALVEQLKQGADFAKLATEHSDEAASKDLGGDMGYLHNGMLPTKAQVALDEMKIGEVSEPLRLLEGVVVLKLADRSETQLNAFDKVEDRARALLMQEQAEQAWATLTERLRNNAVVELDTSHYLPLEKQEEQIAAAVEAAE